MVIDQMREIDELQAARPELESRSGWSERPAARIARRADDLVVKAAPQGTMRHDALRSAFHGLQRLFRRRPARLTDTLPQP